jgi:predicted small lipoprotein YifL
MMTAPAIRRRCACLALLLLLLAAVAPLAACGKKSDPGPPPGEPDVYQQLKYPRQ